MRPLAGLLLGVCMLSIAFGSLVVRADQTEATLSFIEVLEGQLGEDRTLYDPAYLESSSEAQSKADAWSKPLGQEGVVVPTKDSEYWRVNPEGKIVIPDTPLGAMLLAPETSVSVNETLRNLLAAVKALPPGTRIHKRSDGEAGWNMLCSWGTIQSQLAERGQWGIFTSKSLRRDVLETQSKTLQAVHEIESSAFGKGISFCHLIVNPASPVNGQKVGVDKDAVGLLLLTKALGVEAPPTSILDVIGLLFPSVSPITDALGLLNYSSVPDVTTEEIVGAGERLATLARKGIVSTVMIELSVTGERAANELVGLPVGGTVRETAGAAGAAAIALSTASKGGSDHVFGVTQDSVNDLGFADSSECYWDYVLGIPSASGSAGLPPLLSLEDLPDPLLFWDLNVQNPSLTLSWAVDTDGPSIEGNRAPIGPADIQFAIPYEMTKPWLQIKDPSWYDTGCLTFSDPDGDELSIRVKRRPRLGSLDTSVHGGGGMYSVTLQYGINQDWAIEAHRGALSYVDRFSVIATDPHGASAETKVTITVEVTNTSPECGPDTAATEVGQSVSIGVLGNDSDADQDTLRIEDVGDPAHGAASASGSSVRYTPDPGFFGTDGFTYTVSDGHGGTATGGVTVEVIDPYPPVFHDGPSFGAPIVNDPGLCSAVVSWAAPVIGSELTDNLGIADLECSKTSGTSFAVGRTSASYTATDLAGNKSSYSFAHPLHGPHRRPPTTAVRPP